MLFSKKICRFCLKSVENYIIINNEVREVIGSLCTVNFFSKNLHISVFNTDQEYTICEFCLTYLEKAERLIQTSKQTMTKFSDALDCLPCKIIKLDWLPMFTNISKQDTVCCICFQIINSLSAVFLYKNSTNLLPHYLVRKMLTYTTIVLSRRIMDPVMCLECWILVQEVYTFKKSYDGVESKIRIFCKNNVKTHVTSNDLYKIVYEDCHSAGERSQSIDSVEHFQANAISTSATLTGLDDVENTVKTDYLNLQGPVQSKQKVECWLSSIQNDAHRKKLQAVKGKKTNGNKIKMKPNIKKRSLRSNCVKQDTEKLHKTIASKKSDKGDVHGLQIYLEHKFSDVVKAYGKKRKSKGYEWKTSFKKHDILEKYRRKSPFHCLSCNFITNSDIAVLRHMSAHNNGSIVLHLCDICGYKVPNRLTFASHLKTHKANPSEDILAKPKIQIVQDCIINTNRKTWINNIDKDILTSTNKERLIRKTRLQENYKAKKGDSLQTTCLNKNDSPEEYNCLDAQCHNNSEADSDITHFDPTDIRERVQNVLSHEDDSSCDFLQNYNLKNNIFHQRCVELENQECISKNLKDAVNCGKDGLSSFNKIGTENLVAEENVALDVFTSPKNTENNKHTDLNILVERVKINMDISEQVAEKNVTRKNVKRNKTRVESKSILNQDCVSKNLENTVNLEKDGLSHFNNTKTENSDVFTLLKNTENKVKSNITEHQQDINEQISEKIMTRENIKRYKTRIADDLDVLKTSDGEVPEILESNVIQTRSKSRLGLLKKYRKQKHRNEENSSNDSEKPMKKNTASKHTDLNEPSNSSKQPTISNMTLSESSKTISAVKEISNLNSLSRKDEHSDNDNDSTFADITMSASEDEESANMLGQNQEFSSIQADDSNNGDKCNLLAANNVTPERVSPSVSDVNMMPENSDQNGSGTRNNEDLSGDIFVVDSGDGLLENPSGNNESEKDHSTTDDDVIYCEGKADPIAAYHIEPFKCELCDFSSCLSKTVKRHSEAHKEKKLEIYHCTQCSYKISNWRLLQDHLLTHPPLEISDGEDELLCINDSIANTETLSQNKSDGTNTERRISDEIIEAENNMGEVDIEKSNVVDIIKEHKELLDNADYYNPNFLKPLIPLLRINDVSNRNSNNPEFSSDDDDDDDNLDTPAGALISEIIDNLVTDDSEIQTDTSKPDNQFTDQQETLLLNDAGEESEYLIEHQEQELLKDVDDDHPPELLDLKSEAKCTIAKDEPPCLEPQTTVNEMNIQIQRVWSVSETSSTGDPSSGLTNGQESSTGEGCAGACTDYVRYCQLVNSTVFVCVFCNTGFQSDAERVEHWRIVHPILRFSYKCLLCPREVFRRKEYIVHMLKHHNGLKYRCALCDKIFIGPEFLEKHVLAHRGITTSFCGFCMKKNFGTRNVLCSCIKCGRNFSGYRILWEHSRNSNCMEDMVSSSVKVTNTNGSCSVLKRLSSDATQTAERSSNGINVSINENKKRIVENHSRPVSADGSKNNAGSETILKAHPTVFYQGKRLLVVNPKKIPSSIHTPMI